MVVAMNKYLANSTIATVETKSIEDARLPDLYFCINDASLDNRFQEHGYYEIYHFLQGRDICFQINNTPPPPPPSPSEKIENEFFVFTSTFS